MQNLDEIPYGMTMYMVGGVIVLENTVEVSDNEIDSDEKSASPISISKLSKIKSGKDSSIATITVLLLLLQMLF